MDNLSITLTLSPALYDRAQQIASATNQPLEAVLIQQIEQALNDPLATLPPDEQAELHALTYLSDEALWTIAREKMPADKQARLQVLMDKNNLAELTPAEQQEFDELVEQGQKLMLRKAQAGATLTERGYTISPQLMDE